MSVEELGKFLPVVLINKQYTITSLNETAKTMLGDVVGKKCYQALYDLEKPCSEFDIKCPILTKEEEISTLTLNFEVYLRAYGKLPVGGLYWESLINITNIPMLRAGTIDMLTGLHTKSFMMGFLRKLIHMAKRYDETFSVLAIEIIDLTKISEEFGSLSADEAVKKVADCLKRFLRKSDVGIRFGSSELLAILPKTKKEEALKVASRIRGAIESTPFITRLSVSMGVVEGSKDEKDPEELIEKALEFAKKSKKSGNIEAPV